MKAVILFSNSFCHCSEVYVEADLLQLDEESDVSYFPGIVHRTGRICDPSLSGEPAEEELAPSYSACVVQTSTECIVMADPQRQEEIVCR